MPPISKDNLLYFITSVTHCRIPVFQTDKLKQILAEAFNEARKSCGCRIYAYIFMPEHYHVITDGKQKPSDILRYLNGISARRVISYLKENGYSSSLDKLRRNGNFSEHKYTLWDHHSNTFLITSESMLMKKAFYIHQNPVMEGLVEDGAEYVYSSFRYWSLRPLLQEEPIEVDLRDLRWRQSR